MSASVLGVSTVKAADCVDIATATANAMRQGFEVTQITDVEQVDELRAFAKYLAEDNGQTDAAVPEADTVLMGLASKITAAGEVILVVGVAFFKNGCPTAGFSAPATVLDEKWEAWKASAGPEAYLDE